MNSTGPLLGIEFINRNPTYQLKLDPKNRKTLAKKRQGGGNRERERKRGREYGRVVESPLAFSICKHICPFHLGSES